MQTTDKHELEPKEVLPFEVVFKPDKQCKGCRLNEKMAGKTHFCVYVVKKIPYLCPCLTCLIKTMCNKEDCKLRSSVYYDNVERSQDGKDNVI